MNSTAQTPSPLLARIDPEIARYITSGVAKPQPGPGVSFDKLRADYVALCRTMQGTHFDELAQVQDHAVPVGDESIPIRLYSTDAAQTLPLLLYTHGGGFLFGDLDSHDGICRLLARYSGCRVVALTYRRPPENPYPVPVDDCERVLEWLGAHAAEFKLDTTRTTLAGESAGAALALAVARRVPASVAQLLLIVPAIDATTSTPSYDEFATGLFSGKEEFAGLWHGYLADFDRDKQNPDASPFWISDLAQLPPTLIFSAEYDVARDEAEQLGERLQQAGVPTTVTRLPGMVHEFPAMLGVSKAALANMQQIATTLRETIHQST